MKPFVFNLQAVLEVRRIREDQARTELAAVCYRERQEEERLQSLCRQKLDLQERLMQGSVVLSGAQLLAAAQVGHSLDLAICDSQQQKAELERERAAKLEQTQAAIAQRKTLEMLREKAWERYQYECAAAAERQVDDLICTGRGGPGAASKGG